MEDQPLIVPPKNPKVIQRRDIEPEKIAELIGRMKAIRETSKEKLKN